MKKNIHGVTGALHQSLASFQRKSINVGTYGSDMKLNLDENKHDDKPLSFEKDNFLHSNEPQVNLQGSHNISIESNRENNMKKNRSLDSNDES